MRNEPPFIDDARAAPLDLPPEDASGLIRWPDGTLGSSAPWLRAQLERHGIELAGNSSLARSLDATARFQQYMRANGEVRFGSARDAYMTMATVFGVDVLSKSLHAAHDHKVSVTQAHFRSLASGDPLVLRPSKQSEDRDKTWEAVIAGVASTFCERVEFAEPDVVCTFQGKRFGVAAKLPYADARLTRTIKKGIEQAVDRAACDGSLVFVNAVQLMDHLGILRHSIERQFASNDEALEFLSCEVAMWCDKLELEKIAERFRRSGSGDAGVCVFFPMIVEVANNLTPCWMLQLPLISAREGLDYRFACAFQAALNTIGAKRAFEPIA